MLLTVKSCCGEKKEEAGARGETSRVRKGYAKVPSEGPYKVRPVVPNF